MACMDTKGTESMDPSDEKKKFVAAGNHFKINCFIIAANKKILISAVLMTFCSFGVHTCHLIMTGGLARCFKSFFALCM
jgi:hypothetical protein